MELPAARAVDLFTFKELGFADAAAFPAGKELGGLEVSRLWVKLSLRIVIDYLVIVGIIVFIISSLMPDLLSPGVFRSTPGTARLDCEVVDALTDAEEALLTPLGTPGVTNIPVLVTFLSFAPTDNGHLVYGVHITRVVAVDASSVVIE